jgi:hypothetical protein
VAHFADRQIHRLWLASVIATFLALASSCGSSGPSSLPGPGSGTSVSVSISPNTASISAGGSQTFTATVSGTSNMAVAWSTSAGSISGSGSSVTYTAPSSAGSYTVTATSAADSTKSATATIIVSAGSGSAADCSGLAVGQGASLNGFRPFPSTNPWNQDISTSPIDANSASIISYIGATVGLHADFGSGTLSGSSIGIPYVVVDSTQPKVNVAVNIYAGESDVTPTPIPPNAPIEGFPNPGDNHVLVLDKSGCWLYEFYQGSFANGQWSASGSAIWDLQNYNNRPYTWTSADAAGLPIFPGLIRYDEVAALSIKHAIRFTVPKTQSAFVNPATHWAGTNSTSPIPMGMRLRLKSSFDVSTFSAMNQVILNAMKTYGLILADNGSAMFISGAPDSRWDNNDLHQLGTVTASSFEVVQMPTAITSNNVLTGAAPTISSLSASAMTVAPGTSVTLNWQASGASYYFVNPEAGPVRGTSIVVNPTATTTYTLAATNAYGRNTASITIQVQ